MCNNQAIFNDYVSSLFIGIVQLDSISVGKHECKKTGNCQFHKFLLLYMLSKELGLSATDELHLNTAARFKFDTKCSFCLVRNM